MEDHVETVQTAGNEWGILDRMLAARTIWVLFVIVNDKIVVSVIFLCSWQIFSPSPVAMYVLPLSTTRVTGIVDQTHCMIAPSSRKQPWG